MSTEEGQKQEESRFKGMAIEACQEKGLEIYKSSGAPPWDSIADMCSACLDITADSDEGDEPMHLVIFALISMKAGIEKLEADTKKKDIRIPIGIWCLMLDALRKILTVPPWDGPGGGGTQIKELIKQFENLGYGTVSVVER